MAKRRAKRYKRTKRKKFGKIKWSTKNETARKTKDLIRL